MVLKSDMSNLFLGIDIGGSSVKYGWGDSKTGLLHFAKVPLQNASKKALSDSVNHILSTVNSEIGPAEIVAVGVGTPGMINKQTGRIEGINPNLSDWVDIDPKSIFPEEISTKVIAENDANLMALAEAKLLPEVTHVLGITIGSGIGCGYVINGQIYRGTHGFAMELGHNTVVIDGALCNCGRRGCLEAYSSVNGMLNLIRNSGLQNEGVTNMQDLLLNSKKNGQIKKIIDKSVEYLSIAISNLVIDLDVEAVVLGGGVMEIGYYPGQELKNRISNNLPNLLSKTLIVKTAVLGNKAGVMGAIHLAESEFV